MTTVTTTTTTTIVQKGNALLLNLTYQHTRTKEVTSIMKRKKNTSSNLFYWGEAAKRAQTDFGDPNGRDDDFSDQPDRPQLELILKKSRAYANSMPLPYELMLKIFNHVIEISDNPFGDLCNLARVCETWRQMVLNSPTLWTRMDLASIPVTDKNLLTLSKVFKSNLSIIENVKEVTFGGTHSFKSNHSTTFVENLITAPNVATLTFRQMKSNYKNPLPTILAKSINSCKNLRNLSLVQSGVLMNNPKWFGDFLQKSGSQLEVLNLSMSFTSIPSQILKAIGSDFCPNLKVLDISTCDALLTHTIDASQLAKNMPMLEVLRVGNVSFKRVLIPPQEYNLKHLRELSMPIGTRDTDRDDALFATLTFGSTKMTTLDLRGCCVSPHALLDMPSLNVKELHMDDLCPIMRKDYSFVLSKWSHSLEILSLVKINSPETLKNCLTALYELQEPKIKEFDLSQSDVKAEDLLQFLKKAKRLESINLSSCRSLPRGSKGEYSAKSNDRGKKLSLLMKKLN